MSAQRTSQHNERATFSHCSSLSYSFFNYSIKKLISTSNEYQLQFTLQTFEKNLQLNIRKIVRLYNILRTTLIHCINSRSIYIDIITNLQKLTTLKEKMIVQKIFNLNSRRFLLRMYDIEDIANQLLTIYNTIYIGPR